MCYNSYIVRKEENTMTNDQKLVQELWIGDVNQMGTFDNERRLREQIEATNRLLGTDYVVETDDGEHFYVARRPLLVKA